MLSKDNTSCELNDLAEIVAQRAGYKNATSQNSFKFGACDSMCPVKLEGQSEGCPAILPCLQRDASSSMVYAICADGDSAFQVIGERDLVFR